MTLAGTVAGEAVEVERFDGKHLRLVSARAFAPGEPMVVKVALDATPLTLDLKSLGSVRRSDGRFDVRARPATLTRGARERLLAAFAVD